MNALIKSAKIIDPKSSFHNQTKDLLIENGIITKIANKIPNPKNYKELTFDDLHISNGWFDS
ncbi:MAG: dihydroorotase, partial [Flavobacteriaceae bacterium]|nr:dihydroorotase [Flavobacteriaceae bacterium]